MSHVYNCLILSPDHNINDFSISRDFKSRLQSRKTPIHEKIVKNTHNEFDCVARGNYNNISDNKKINRVQF